MGFGWFPFSDSLKRTILTERAKKEKQLSLEGDDKKSDKSTPKNKHPPRHRSKYLPNNNKGKPLEVVLLLGGEGARFASEGYLRPKVLVNLHGRPMIYWVLKLLDIHPEDHITIAYHKVRLR